MVPGGLRTGYWMDVGCDGGGQQRRRKCSDDLWMEEQKKYKRKLARAIRGSMGQLNTLLSEDMDKVRCSHSMVNCQNKDPNIGSLCNPHLLPSLSSSEFPFFLDSLFLSGGFLDMKLGRLCHHFTFCFRHGLFSIFSTLLHFNSCMPIHLIFSSLHVTQLYPVSDLADKYQGFELILFHSHRLMLVLPWGPLRLSRGCPSRPTASLRVPPLVLTAWAGEDASPTPVSIHSGSFLCTSDTAVLFRFTWL